MINWGREINTQTISSVVRFPTDQEGKKKKEREKDGPQIRRKKSVHSKGNKSLLKEEMQFFFHLFLLVEG